MLRRSLGVLAIVLGGVVAVSVVPRELARWRLESLAPVGFCVVLFYGGWRWLRGRPAG